MDIEQFRKDHAAAYSDAKIKAENMITEALKILSAEPAIMSYFGLLELKPVDDPQVQVRLCTKNTGRIAHLEYNPFWVNRLTDPSELAQAFYGESLRIALHHVTTRLHQPYGVNLLSSNLICFEDQHVLSKWRDEVKKVVPTFPTYQQVKPILDKTGFKKSEDWVHEKIFSHLMRTYADQMQQEKQRIEQKIKEMMQNARQQKQQQQQQQQQGQNGQHQQDQNGQGQQGQDQQQQQGQNGQQQQGQQGQEGQNGQNGQEGQNGQNSQQGQNGQQSGQDGQNGQQGQNGQNGQQGEGDGQNSGEGMGQGQQGSGKGGNGTGKNGQTQRGGGPGQGQPDNSQGDGSEGQGDGQGQGQGSGDLTSDQIQKLMNQLDQFERNKPDMRGQDAKGKGQGDAASALDEYFDTSEQHAQKMSEKWGENDSVDEKIQEITEHIASDASRWGNMSGALKQMIMEANAPKFDPTVVVRHFKQEIQSEEMEDTRTKVNRRCGFTRPGWRHKMKSSVLFAIDCSGSMSDENVALGEAFVNKFIKHAKVSYCFWDGVCGDITDLKRKERNFELVGRGCTNPQCVLDKLEEERLNYGGIIFFTDNGFYWDRPKSKWAKKIFIISTDDACEPPAWVKYHLNMKEIQDYERRH